MKNADSLVALSSVLTRTLRLFVGIFLMAWCLLLAAYSYLWSTAYGTVVHWARLEIIGFCLLPLLVLLPLAFFTRRYLTRLIADPVAHLIANTQLGVVQQRELRSPVTHISELNLLARSIKHMTFKLQQRENFILDSEKRLSLALSGSGEGIWDWNIKLNTSYIDDNCCEIIGVTPAEIKLDNRLWIKYLHPDDIASAKSYFRQAAAGSINSFEREYRLKKPTMNNWIWIQVRGSVVERDAADHPIRMAGTISDVTLRKNAEQQLKLYSTAFMCTKNAVMMLDKDFIVLAVNRAFCDITQQQGSMVVGRHYVFYHPTIPVDKFHDVVSTQVHNRTQWLGETFGKRADGSSYPQDLAIYGVFDDQITLTHYVVIFSDITERKRAEDNLRLLANYDPLTGLPNRYMFNTTLIRSLQSARRKEEQLALLFIDLDHFKQVNDLYGHEAGDRLLVEVACRIQNSIRETDTAARLAGDEFVVVLEDIQTRNDVEVIATKILNSMVGLNENIGAVIDVSASIGISLFPDDGADVETMLRKADRAMYEAKKLGRNRLAFHNPDSSFYQSVCMDSD